MFFDGSIIREPLLVYVYGGVQVFGDNKEYVYNLPYVKPRVRTRVNSRAGLFDRKQYLYYANPNWGQITDPHLSKILPSILIRIKF